MKARYLKLVIVFFLLFTLIFFLEVCPPLDRLSFNWWLLGLCIFSFFYGYLGKDYSIVGFFIPVANGFSRLSPHFYPVSSLLSLLALFGFILNERFDDSIYTVYKEHKKTVWVIFSFFVVNILSTFWSFLYLNYPGIVYPINAKGELSFHMTFHVVGYFFLPFATSILLFFVNLFFKNENVINRLFKYFMVGIFISCIAGILQHLGILKDNFGYIVPWYKRVNGLFSNFNSFAMSISLFLPVLFYYVFFNFEKFLYKMFVLLLTFICIINLLLTATRSALLCVFLSLFMILLVFAKEKIFLTSLKIFFIVLVVNISVFYIIRFPVEDTVFNRLINVELKKEIKDRSMFWKAGFDLFKNNVFVGNGIKSVYINFYNIVPLKYYLFSDNACNTYIQYLAEIGIIGIFIFLVIIFFIFNFLFYAIINKKFLEVMVAISLVSFLAVSIFGHHLDSEEVSLLFWFLLSLICVKEKNKFYLVKYILSSLVLMFFILSFYLNFKQLKNFNIFRYRNYAGVYEKAKFDGKEGYWTDKYAVFNRENFKKKKAVFKFKRVNKKNQEVSVFLDNKFYQKIKLESDEWYELEIPLNLVNFSTIKIIPKIVSYEAGILRYIFPFIGKDYRRLGVVLNFYGAD
ncbi:MAG: O-antigen ligase family protein [Endomicrobia bacterium]|nr:O-antigen ligase family protein [Endomicrobiia bacterium]